MSNNHTYELLSQINYPKDLRKLSLEQLPQVCKELRQNIIDELDLLKPIYQKTACYGHFGREEFSWEKIKQ